MRRHLLRFSQLLIDFAALTAAFALAFFLRFDWIVPADMLGRFLLTAPYVVLGEYMVLVLFGVHRFSWRHIGLREVVKIFVATAAASAVLLAVRFALGELQSSYAFLRHGVLPFGVLAANTALMFMGVTGVRVLRRFQGERMDKARVLTEQRETVPTMLVGAGQAGVLVAREVASRGELGIKPIGFLDDDPLKVGSLVHGIPVLGTTDQLAKLCTEHGASQVLITIASAPGREIRRITRLCEEARLPAKIIPGLYEIVGGGVNLTRIRDVAIEDLLRREPVQLEEDAISASIRDKVVLVTGAGGSIGSEICRQVCSFAPRRLVLVERAENNLFNVHRELAEKFPALELVPCIADITDRARMEHVFATHAPALVFHAAAHKHVPMMEWNPAEAVKNNVFGTQTVAELAHEHAADAFVMISTDKAVNPTSVMGASKRGAELCVQAIGARSTTRFVTVRFGNVLGSAGSVVPIFKEQIARGGPVTITHPDMVRYFMTIPEACQLVLQAGTMGAGGEIFVLDMGEPVPILELAKDLIRLSGLRAGEDIEIVFTGCRPGEKLFEEIATGEEHAEKTRHPKIFVGRTERRDPAKLDEQLAALKSAIPTPERVPALLRALVPEFTPSLAPTELPRPPRERRISRQLAVSQATGGAE